MLYAFVAYYSRNYAGILGAGLLSLKHALYSARPSLVPRPHPLQGLVHEDQIIGPDGKFSHYEYHYLIHGRSGKV